MSALRIALVPLLLGVGATMAMPVDGTAQEGRQGPTVTVVAENQASVGAHVYVIQRGHMVHLGFVEPGAGETLTIPSAAIQSEEPIQLVADLLRTPDWYKSDPVTVRSGAELAFTIESEVDRSTVSVRG